MISLVLYVHGHELFRQEIQFPESEKRLDRHGKIDLRKAFIDYQVEKIKVMFFRQLSKFDYKIFLEIESKINKQK